MSFTEVLVNIINWYLSVFDWILTNIFFFVNIQILKLFALSFLIMNLNKLFEIRKPWVRWLISILYGLYCLLKVVPIRDFMITFDVSQLPNVLPYFCMVILPILVGNTEYGRVLLNYYTICVYYVIINAVWLSVDLFAGNLTITLIFSGVVFFIAQLGGL